MTKVVNGQGASMDRVIKKRENLNSHEQADF